MFAVVKQIKKPIRRKDFRLPTGELPAPDERFVWGNYGFWQFKNIPIYGCLDLVKAELLAVVQRVELKIELHHRFRNEGKVFSRAWHLASIMQSDIANAGLRQSFYNKIENKLKNKEFELSPAETAAIWKKIEAAVPKHTV